MKRLTLLPVFAIAVLSFNANAIQFFEDADVLRATDGEEVIQVRTGSFAQLIEGTDCALPATSFSALAYVVRKGNKTALYYTHGPLEGLTHCRDL